MAGFSRSWLPPFTGKVQIGIVSDRTSASDYDADMQRAKAIGIDAFALNIGQVAALFHTTC